MSATMTQTPGVQAAPPGMRAGLIALAGPAAIGACVGWPIGAEGMMTVSALLPLSFVAVGLMTLPGLYVGAALVGAAPDAREMAAAVLNACRDQGIALLGLAPALLFLCATATDIHEAMVMGTIGVMLGTAVGMRAFYHRLREVAHSGLIMGIFAIWAMLSAGLGWEIYLRVLAAGGGL